MSPIQNKIIVMFFIMAIGYICGKAKLITEEGNKQLSRLSLWVVNPILIFMSFQSKYSPQMAKNLLIVFCLTIAVFAIMIALATLLIPKKSKSYGVERLSLVLTNCGFVGIPLAQSAFDSEGVMYITMFLAVFIFVTWTWGVMQMTEKITIRDTLKNLVSPAIISVVLGLICYFTRLTLPQIIAEPLDYVGEMNTPLAMIVAGATLSYTNILNCFKKPKIYYITLLRLFVFPALCALLTVPLFRLGVDAMPLGAVVVGAACPTAVVTTMLSHIYNKDSLWASELFAMSTLFSVISVPTVMWFLKILGVA